MLECGAAFVGGADRVQLEFVRVCTAALPLSIWRSPSMLDLGMYVDVIRFMSISNSIIWDGVRLSRIAHDRECSLSFSVSAAESSTSNRLMRRQISSLVVSFSGSCCWYDSELWPPNCSEDSCLIRNMPGARLSSFRNAGFFKSDSRRTNTGSFQPDTCP